MLRCSRKDSSGAVRVRTPTQHHPHIGFSPNRLFYRHGVIIEKASLSLCKYKVNEKVKKGLFLVGILCWVMAHGFSARAQVSVTGKLADKETGAPVSKVNVQFTALATDEKTGAATDNDGSFRLTLPAAGTYLVQYSHLNYKTKKDTVQVPGSGTLALGTVKLKADNRELPEVKIEDQQKTVFDESSDKRIYSPDDMQLQSGASAIEFLQTVPSLNITNKGKITLRGNSDITVMIDGKLAGVSSSGVRAILENLPIASIERVEIMDNPTAKMNAQGSGGIINIVTKKGTNKGISGSLTVNVGMREKANGSAFLSYRGKKAGFYTTYGYRYGKYAFRANETGYNRVVLPDTAIQWNYGKQVVGTELEGAHSGGLGIDWTPNVYNTVTLSGFASYVYGITKSEGYYRQYFTDQPDFEYFVRNVYQLNNELNAEGSLLWTKKFRKPKQQWDTEVNYGHTNERTVSELGRLRDGENRHQNTLQTQRLHFVSVRSDFTLPIGTDMKFETGIRYAGRLIRNAFDASVREGETAPWVPDSTLINAFRYTEHVAAFYGEFTHKIKKWKYRLGFRGEPTYIRTFLENGNVAGNRFYFGWFPFAGVYRDITKRWEVKLTFARRISRPKPGSLNPFTDFSDPLDLRFGNPNLKPEYLNTVEFAAQYKKDDYLFKGALFGRIYNQPFGRIRYLDTSGVVVTSTMNYRGEQQAGLELIGSAKLFKALTLTANLNLYYSHIDATDVFPGLRNSLFGYEAKLTAAWFLPKIVSGLFVFNYRGPEILVQGQTWGTWRMNLSLRRSFWKNRITLSASVQDIFNTWYSLRTTRTYDVDRNSVRKDETRIFMAGITFRFGKNKNAGNDDNSFDRERKDEP